MNKRILLILAAAFLAAAIIPSLASATIEQNPYNLSKNTNTDATTGMKISVGTTGITLLEVELGSASTATTVYLQDDSHNQIVNSSVSGGNATFNTTLNTSTTYYIVSDAQGVAYTTTFQDTGVTFPVNGTFITWEAGARDNFPGWGDESTIARDIQSIRVEEIPDPVNATVQAQDSFDGSSINNFTVTFNSTNYTTTNGTVVLPILNNNTELWNLTYYSNESGGYFFSEYSDINLSSTHTGILHQLRVIANDSYTGSNLSNFSVTWQASTFSTTSGLIRTNLDDPLGGGSYDLTVDSTESGGYFNATNNNWDSTEQLNESLHQSRVTFFAENRVSGDSVTDFTAQTSSNGGFASNTITNPVLYLSSSNDFLAEFNKSSWYPSSTTFNTSAETEQNETFSVYDHIANFSIDVLAGGATENNFTLSIYSVEHSFYEEISTTNGLLEANLTAGNYTVWINDTYHDLSNHSIELNSSSNFTSFTLDSYTTNTVDITFRDEETGAIIDDRVVTAFFTGSVISYNESTSNGTLLLDMINPQTYDITYDADGYAQRAYTFTLTNRTFNTLDLYLINETEDELILTSVQDSFLDPVPNAVVRAQKKNLSGTNYYTVETCTTDNNGECLLHLVLYDTTYRFLIIVDGSTVLTSSDQTIKQTTLSFRVNLETDSLEEINNVFGITGSLFYDKNDEEIEFTWNDPNSLGVTACLDVDTRQGASLTDYNESCTTSASGTIIIPIDTNLSVTYEAVGYVTVDGTRYELDRLSVAGNNFSTGLGTNGLFIFGFLVLGIAAFTGLWNPVVGPIITASVIWFFNYIGFITLGTAAVTSLLIGAIMVAYLSRS